MRQFTFIAMVMTISGCSNYDSYPECVQRELKGDSEAALKAARSYCREIMKSQRDAASDQINPPAEVATDAVAAPVEN